MHRAFELYLQERDGRRRLELYACDTTEQVMQKAREVLDEEDLEAVDVQQAGEHLFTVTR